MTVPPLPLDLRRMHQSGGVASSLNDRRGKDVHWIEGAGSCLMTKKLVSLACYDFGRHVLA